MQPLTRSSCELIAELVDFWGFAIGVCLATQTRPVMPPMGKAMANLWPEVRGTKRWENQTEKKEGWYGLQPTTLAMAILAQYGLILTTSQCPASPRIHQRKGIRN